MKKMAFLVALNWLFLGGWLPVTWGFQNPQAEQAFRESARRGDLQAVEKAIASGVSVDAASDYGVTALAMASDHGHEEIVKALLKAGANPSVKDKFYRFTPLGWSMSKGHFGIAKQLIESGATDVDAFLPTVVVTKNEELLGVILQSPHLTTAGKQQAIKSAWQLKLTDWADRLNATLPEADRVIEPTSQPANTDQVSLQEYAGTYRTESGTKLTVSATPQGLELRGEDSERGLRLQSEGNDRFTARGIEFVFVRESGKIVSIKQMIGDRESVMSRVDDRVVAPPETPIVDSAEETRIVRDFTMESKHWPQFRGEWSRGIATCSMPTAWDGESGSNVAWKVAIPGLGTSSPAVWGDRVFVTTAIQENEDKGFRVGPYGDVESVPAEGNCEYWVYCLALSDGEVIWRRKATQGIPKVKRHAKSSHANPTPATNGQVVVASFGGEGIFGYDMEGNLLWSKQLGMLDSGWFYDRSYQWGFGSSPCLFEDMAFLQCDIQDGSFLLAVDWKTGEDRWRTDREEIPTWSSPVAFYSPEGQPMVVVAGTKCSAGYDARTGKQLWKLGGFSEIVVPTPQVMPDAVLLTSGYVPIQPIVFLQHSARGDLKVPESKKTEGPFVWHLTSGGPYMPSPLIFDGSLYVLDNGGILSSFSMVDGKRKYRQRVRNDEANAYTASPITDGKYLLAISESGIAFVCDLHDQCKIVQQNKLGESVLASPALAQGVLLIRGEKHLYAIGQ